MKKLLRLLAICGLAITSTVAWAANEKLSAELQPQRTTIRPGNVEVIVQYKTVPTEAHH